MSKIYQALGPNIFVEEITKEEKIGGLYVPDSLEQDFTYGEVLSCSEGYWEKGSFIPNNICVGDVIAFPKVAGTKITLGGKKYIRVYASDVIAKEVEGEILEKEGNKDE